MSRGNYPDESQQPQALEAEQRSPLDSIRCEALAVSGFGAEATAISHTRVLIDELRRAYDGYHFMNTESGGRLEKAIFALIDNKEALPSSGKGLTAQVKQESLQIQGLSLREYLDYQFPATRGHRPLIEWLDRFEAGFNCAPTVSHERLVEIAKKWSAKFMRDWYQAGREQWLTPIIGDAIREALSASTKSSTAKR